MVFESIVVDLMNKYLGEYIENLDSSQLKLGIWGGDAVLENLHIKGDALKDLNLPVEIKFGHIGKLTLKIPWKNLYKEAVTATLDGLYLLAVPNSEIVYDAEKEAKREQDAKQAQLTAIEEQQLKSKQAPAEDKQDSFVEKLATQVIKNLQIHISNIHIRYEDKVTIKGNPFALGVTLHRLSFETTNENWIPCLLDESVKIIYKMVDLQSLAVYWNPVAQQYLLDSSRSDQLSYFKDSIANPDNIPKDFKYIIKPITLQVRLRLNPHPHSDLSTPKIVLSVLMQEIGLRVMHEQYHGIMELVESMDRMVLSAPFRKFKPTVPLKGNASKWWKYAYDSILSTGMVVASGKWSWSNIKEHKRKIREYKVVYKEKLQQKKPPQKLLDKLIEMENNLDIFNITLARQTSEVELVKAGKQIRSKQSVHQLEDESKKSGWFSGWFGKKPSEKDKKIEEESSKKSGLDSVMTDEEKQSLYDAIGYTDEEKISDTSDFEKSYIGLRLNVGLKQVSVELSDSSISSNDLLSLRLTDVSSVIEQRPSAQALGVTAHMSSFVVDGLVQGDFLPCIISSNTGSSRTETDEKQRLLSLLFETKPLDETCDQRIVVDSQPLQITYDAQTINNLVEFFKPPEDVQLQQLRTVAASAYDDIKEQTATGLKHAMEMKNVVEIGIRLSSSYVIFPHSGLYKNETDCLVLDLGEISFRSSNDGRVPLMTRDAKATALTWMQQENADDTLNLQEMRSKAYDNFTIDVKRIQLLYARKGDDWMAARNLEKSPMHILQPLNVSVLLQKCIITNDSALPRVKITGEIPSLQLGMSDKKLHDILALVESVPFPTPDVEEEEKRLKVLEAWKKDRKRTDLNYLNNALSAQLHGSSLSMASGKRSSTDEEFFSAHSELESSDSEVDFKSAAQLQAKAGDVQMTDVKILFSIKEMVATVTEDVDDGSSIEWIKLRIGTLSTEVTARTWDVTVGANLQSISVQLTQFTQPNGSPLYLLDSSATVASEHLLDVEFVQVKRQSPNFQEIHKKTEQTLLIKFGTLKLGLHAQAVLQLAKFANKLLDIPSAEQKSNVEPVPSDTQRSFASAMVSTTSTDEYVSATDVLHTAPVKSAAATKKPKSSDNSIIKLKLQAELDCVEITVMDTTKMITSLQIQHVNTNITMTAAYVKVEASLSKLLLNDPSEDTLYEEIICSHGVSDLLEFELIQYNDATKDKKAFEDMKNVDTSIYVKLGSLKVVFLNKFVESIIDYVSNFSELQEVAANAGSAAQEKASAKAQELAEKLEETNPRVKLDVTLYAPTIVVPAHSKSRDAITAYLGTLMAANHFSGTSLEQGFSVLDQMTVSLRDVNVAKCKLDNELNPIDEVPILEGVILKVQIIRNLSASWYHDVPQVNINGEMPPFSIDLSQPDMAFLMDVINGNLNEGKGKDTAVKEVVEKKADAKLPAKEEPKPKVAKSKQLQPAKASTVWEKLKLHFLLENVIIKLFQDAQRKHMLSTLECRHIQANMSMKNDESLNADFCFGELALEDSRESSAGGITKLIQNRVRKEGTHLISAKITQMTNGAVDVDAVISSISIIVSVEFIMNLADFFIKSLPEKSETEQQPEPSRAVALENEPGIADSVKPPTSKSVIVSFKMEEPEIVLVTDVKSTDAEAIVLGMGLNMNYNITEEGSKQLMSAELSNLYITGCAFKCILEKTIPTSVTHKNILSPCNISLNGLIADNEQDFDVSITDIRLKASPVIIQTISDIAAQMDPSSAKATEEDEDLKKDTNPLTIWSSKKIADMKFWFMKENEGTPVDSVTEFEAAASETVAKRESARFAAPMLQIVLEAGSGYHTIPLLIAESTLKGNVSDWSSGEMNGEFVVTLGVAYFNDSLSLWEPLIEPVEVDPTALKPTYEPWKLTSKLQQRKPTPEDKDNADLPPLMTISLESKNFLQTTITNAALKVMKDLGVAFKDAALSKQFGKVKNDKSATAIAVEDSGAAVILKNHLGFEVDVKLGKALCVVDEKTNSKNGYVLQHKDHLLIDYCAVNDADLWSVLSNQESKATSEGAVIFIQIEANHVCSINISQTCSTLHMISSKLPIVSVVKCFAGIRTVTLHSHVVLYNHLSVDMEVYRKTEGDHSLLGSLPANRHYSVPPILVSDFAVKIKPVTENGAYSPCMISWKEAMEVKELSYHSETVVKCVPTHEPAKTMNINVEFGEEKLEHAKDIKSQPGISIHLRPPIIFCNYLPFVVKFQVIAASSEGSYKEIEPGHSMQVLDGEVGKNKLKVLVPSYRENDWTSEFQLDAPTAQLSPWLFTSANGKESITLAKEITSTDGVLHLTLYSPYWMVNKTGLPLDYKSSDQSEDAAVQQQAKGQDVILFAYTSKSFLSKNKLQARVCNSNFSDSFSVDTVGSSGMITCKTKSFNYSIGTRITLTSFSLTKIVTFTSYYSFHNKSDLDLEISEFGANPPIWQEVLAGSKIDLWPEQKEAFLIARLKGNNNSISTKFRYNKLDSGVLLRLQDYGLFVEVSVTEASVDISVRNYFEGATAVLIVNDTTDIALQCWQGKNGTRETIQAGDARHIVWTDPTIQREITWLTSTNKEVTMDVFQEQYSNFALPETNAAIHYVLFVDGLQRILLFTENKIRAKAVEASLRLERANVELNLSLHGITCSLVDTKAHREVAFVGITSSGLVWEEKPNKRWKPLAVKYSQFLETEYQQQLHDALPRESLSLDKYTFDLKSMTVVKPNKCPLQRTFSPGLWVQFTSTSHQMTVHAKVNRLQVDNQLIGAVFPVVLNPVPLPKSIAIDSTPKPFLEISLMQRKSEKQTFMHIKYLKVLVQEFSVKLDMGFITALLPVFGAEEMEATPEQNLGYFKEDVSLTTHHEEKETTEVVNFFDILHLSPIKVHVSFSMQNTLAGVTEEDGNVAKEVVKIPFSALAVLLQSVGVTLSDIDDVVFKLAYFERKYQFFSSAGFANAVAMHYAGQAIKQLYVLVLGLDVIGNPYGLVMGIAEGVTDLFYEPYQGMIQGPGEFFEGLGLGALSLLGHTVGGAAGAVSKVTGALGKGFATMTMDEEYKRKRLAEKNRQPADVKEGLARGGKGLVMGVFSGVTGVVTKPYEGAKKEGAAGFFKGVGKGLIGVVARPVSGVIDLASNTFEGIQKVADMSEDVRKIRPARWIDPHSKVIQPYSLHRAQGNAILEEIDKGRFAQHNRYLDHVPLKPNRRSVLMMTNRMVLTAHTGDILGQWKCNWKCHYSELTEEPHLAGNVLKFTFKKRAKRGSKKKLKLANEPVQGWGQSQAQLPAESSDQQTASVFRPLSRAFSLGKMLGGAITQRASERSSSSRGFLSRSNTTTQPSVHYSRSSINVNTGQQDQAKTKSFFGLKSSHESVTFHDKQYAEYALPLLIHQWKRSSKNGSVSSYDSASDDNSQ